MHQAQQEMIESLINSQSKEDALFALFELLKQKIPFDRVVCYSTNRTTRIVTTFIEYTTEDNIFAKLYQLKNLVPLDSIYKMSEENKFGIIARNAIHVSDPQFIFIEQLPFQVSSLIAFIVDRNEEENSYMYFACFSGKQNTFSNEHIRFLNAVRPYLEKILLELYRNSPEGQVFLASKKIIPISYEEQLRSCPDLKELISEIEVVAPHNVSVLVTGPNGSGKELVASTIHALSTRVHQAFVDVNCAAIPESLLESELFGYEKGAFTGAGRNKKGFFEQANNGTIFLDEIGELSEHAQARLLRVLEHKKIQKIGSEYTTSVDVRVIAATNKNLEQLVQEGKFREDLYYRLKGFCLNVPPLNKRKKDMKYLIEYFYSLTVEQRSIQNPPVISYNTLNKLLHYHWPGNVRQLKHAIEEAIFKALAKKKTEITFDFLDNIKNVRRKKILSAQEITLALKEVKGRIEGVNGAAKLLNVNPSTLRSRMKTLGIPFKKEIKKCR